LDREQAFELIDKWCLRFMRKSGFFAPVLELEFALIGNTHFQLIFVSAAETFSISSALAASTCDIDNDDNTDKTTPTPTPITADVLRHLVRACILAFFQNVSLPAKLPAVVLQMTPDTPLHVKTSALEWGFVTVTTKHSQHLSLRVSTKTLERMFLSLAECSKRRLSSTRSNLATLASKTFLNLTKYTSLLHLIQATTTEHEIPLQRTKAASALPASIKITASFGHDYACARVAVLDASVFILYSSVVTKSIVNTLNSIVLSMPLEKLDSHIAMLVSTTCDLGAPAETGWILDNLRHDISQQFAPPPISRAVMNTIFVHDICEIPCMPDAFRVGRRFSH
jgi:hypothetical protein